MATPARKPLPSSFALMGAKQFEPPSMKRLIMTLDGDPNTGKTDIACQAPDPIAYFSFDRGLDGPIQKYLKKKAIGVFEYELPPKEEQALSIPVWNKFHGDYYKAVANPDVRTIVLDKGGEVWDLLRMSMLGAYVKIPSLKYMESNSLYRQLFRAVKATNKNLLVTHEIEKDYQAAPNPKDPDKEISVWKGEMRRDGFSKLGYLVDASVLCKRNKKTNEFSVEIVEAKRNMTVVGEELEDKDCSFEGIAEMIYGEPFDPSEWGM